MNIWLVDFDGKIENFALMKLSTYHRQKGDMVSLKFGCQEQDLFSPHPDKVYISCLFSWNKDKAISYFDRLGCDKEIGGTGVDPYVSLPEHIENLKPDYTLYGRTRPVSSVSAIGFISRGCIRNCQWCVVPKKEGQIRRVSSAMDITGGFDSAIFLDNNFLAMQGCEHDLEWIASNGVKVDFNQGLDARLITTKRAELLARCKWIDCTRLALDSDSYIPQVDTAISRLQDAGMPTSKIFVYCLIGFSGFESDVKRLMFLHGKGVRVFPMKFRDIETGISPALGWDISKYNKYSRLIIRMPFATSVWNDFEKEITSA